MCGGAPCRRSRRTTLEVRGRGCEGALRGCRQSPAFSPPPRPLDSSICTHCGKSLTSTAPEPTLGEAQEQVEVYLETLQEGHEQTACKSEDYGLDVPCPLHTIASILNTSKLGVPSKLVSTPLVKSQCSGPSSLSLPSSLPRRRTAPTRRWSFPSRSSLSSGTPRLDSCRRPWRLSSSPSSSTSRTPTVFALLLRTSPTRVRVVVVAAAVVAALLLFSAERCGKSATRHFYSAMFTPCAHPFPCPLCRVPQLRQVPQAGRD